MKGQILVDLKPLCKDLLILMGARESPVTAGFEGTLQV